MAVTLRAFFFKQPCHNSSVWDSRGEPPTLLRHHYSSYCPFSDLKNLQVCILQGRSSKGEATAVISKKKNKNANTVGSLQSLGSNIFPYWKVWWYFGPDRKSPKFLQCFPCEPNKSGIEMYEPVPQVLQWYSEAHQTVLSSEASLKRYKTSVRTCNSEISQWPHYQRSIEKTGLVLVYEGNDYSGSFNQKEFNWTNSRGSQRKDEYF